MSAAPVYARLLQMKAEDLLGADARTQVLRAVARRAVATCPGADLEALCARLGAREAESPSLIGAGVALPHACLEGLDAPMIVEVEIDGEIAWAAGEPVRRCVALLEPPSLAAEHLTWLRDAARVAAGS